VPAVTAAPVRPWDEPADTIGRGKIAPAANGSGHVARLPGGASGEATPPPQAPPAADRCTATARSTGQQCRRKAEPGQDKCSVHDGSARAERGSDGHPIAASGRAPYGYICGDCAECEASGRDRGLYLSGELAGPLPYVHARPVSGYGRSAEAGYLLSASAEPGARRVMFGAREIDTGQWQHKLRMAWTADRYLLEAAASAIYGMAARMPEIPAAPPPGVITPAGLLPAVTPECLPEVGYWERSPGLAEARQRQAMRAVARIAAANPNLALLLGASAAGPYAKALGQRSAWWQAYGPSSSGKTTCVICAAALWGNPDETTGLLMSWDNTRKGTGRHLGDLGYLPAFLDESGMAEFKPADWARAILGIGARRLQARLWGNGAQATAPWAGYAFASGNGRMSEGLAVGKFAGVAARIIELDGPFTRSAAESDRLKRLAPLGCGWLGPQILATVTAAMMRQRRDRALTVLDAPAGGVARSIAEHLALAAAGAAAIDDVLGLGGALWWAALGAAEDYLAGHASQPPGDPELLLEELADLMASRAGAFPHVSALGQPHQDRELLGIRDGEHVYLFKAGFRELVNISGVDSDVALAGLHQAGYLIVSQTRRQDGHWTMQAPRASGTRARCYQIRLAALDDGDDSQPSVPGSSPQPGPWADSDQLACPVHQARRGYHSGCPDCRAINFETEAEALSAARTGNDGVINASARFRPDVTPEPAGTAMPGSAAQREAFTAAAMVRHHSCKHAAWGQDQEDALAARLELLDDPAIGERPKGLRLLEVLEGSHGKSGPFAPMRQAIGKGGKPYQRGPWWQPPLPADVIDTAWIAACPLFQREYDGPVITLDRNQSYTAATASVEVAHGQLEHTGPLDLSLPGPVRPGYYLIDAYPWTETGLPSPLGSAKPGTQLWVPAPTAALLADLARQGRWPDVAAADSWTGEPSRLASWAHLLSELRRYALEAHGRDSDAYDAVKAAAGQARTLMKGHLTGGPLEHRQWDCKARRPDIPQHIEAQNTATMWRTADKCLQAAAAGLGPVAIKNTDTLVIPAVVYDLVTGDPNPAIRIDAAELALGSFKIKEPG
jgi:Domain of unknown function (DUF927)